MGGGDWGGSAGATPPVILVAPPSLPGDLDLGDLGGLLPASTEPQEEAAGLEVLRLAETQPASDRSEQSCVMSFRKILHLFAPQSSAETSVASWRVARSEV